MSQPKSSNTSSETPKASTKKTESAPRSRQFSRRAKYLVVFNLLLALLVVVLYLFGRNQLTAQALITPARISIPIEVADSQQEQEQGLSGRSSLDGGMLFVFKAPDKYGFWMKDMKFPIDIVWMDAERRVIAVDANITPETYPKIYYPPNDAMYVLELNAGQAEVLGIHTDQSLRW